MRGFEVPAQSNSNLSSARTFSKFDVVQKQSEHLRTKLKIVKK